MNKATWMRYFMLVLFLVGSTCSFAESVAQPEYIIETEQIEVSKEPVKTQKVKKTKITEDIIAQLTFSEDTTPLLTVKQIQITGNQTITTDKILANIPAVYNASSEPLLEADSSSLYDFRPLLNIVGQPGEAVQISARTIQGFTHFIVSVYQDKGYSGVYAYVPTEAISEAVVLENDILPVKVIEAVVVQTNVTYHDADGNDVEEGYLREDAVMDWTPAKIGQLPKSKKIDDFLNLLNLNPDRYAVATIAEGNEPETLMVSYDLYEVNPWHYFIQLDNSGTKDRKWTPRFGVINTNLLGLDDEFIAMWQSPVDSDIEDNFSVFGSYDVPVFNPRLRLNLYGGYSEFDINPESGAFNFIGSGQFYGGKLRYNLLQKDGWSFDVIGGLSHEESKTRPSVFPLFTASDLKMDFWSVGTEIYKKDDLQSTSFSFNRTETLHGSGSDRDEFTTSRSGTSPDFILYHASAAHNRYLDPHKVQRLSGTFQWIGSNERVPPFKMASFGGMYSVRGYDEYEIIADGGILTSVQYEFDLVKHEAEKNGQAELTESGEQPWLRKLAPLCFFDYGLAKIKDSTATEKTREELMSVGSGLLVELGDNFTGGVYYGYPLRATAGTREGKGRVNVLLLLKW